MNIVVGLTRWREARFWHPAETMARHCRPRPAFLRALGHCDPPREIVIDGGCYHQIEILKHDSWAATSIYEGPAGRIICKLNRRQSIFGIPFAWLGRLLARHETRMLQALQGTGLVPRLFGQPTVNGRVLSNAVAHQYVPGHPLTLGDRVDDNFFSSLQSLLRHMHAEQMAYVDLHKRENVLVGDDGRPYLVDFQISLALPRWWPARAWPVRVLMRCFQTADHYHLLKHWIAHRPDQCRMSEKELARHRPWPIRLHRLLAVPFRTLRRRLLSVLRVRDRRGMAASEFFAEDAVRRLSRSCPQG